MTESMLGDNSSFWWLLIIAMLGCVVGNLGFKLQRQARAFRSQLADAHCQVRTQQWLVEQLTERDFDAAIFAVFEQAQFEKSVKSFKFCFNDKQNCRFTQSQLEDFIAQDDYQTSLAQLIGSKQNQSEANYELAQLQSDGSSQQVNFTHLAVVLRDDEGQPQALVCSLRLVETQTQPELSHQPIFEANKMRALVNLSRGVAHDFNNILGVISGYCEMIAIEYENESKLQGYTEKINAGVERGQGISEQLFSFSRRKKAGQAMVDFESVVLQSILHFNKRLPKTISFDWLLAHTQLKVKLNVQLLPQVINALGQNAIDAMPQGGSLRFFSSVEVLDAQKAAQLDLAAGSYLCFSVVDNGSGIAQQDLSRVVEPYFSTREQLGMGLSLIYGFCQSSDGTIEVNSVESQGTQVNLYFPLLSD